MSVQEIVDAVAETAGPVEVIGGGAVAAAVRTILGSGDSTDRPGVVVETTGAPSSIAEAIRRVRDDGMVVLAGPVPVEDVIVNLYTDVHARGLTLVGLPDEPRGPSSR